MLIENIKYLILKRPAISLFVCCCAILIFLDLQGFYSYQKQTKLFPFAKNNLSVFTEGKIISELKSSKKYNKFILETYNFNTKSLSEKIIINSPKGYSIKYGDVIAVEGTLKLPARPDFPLIFDYQKYLARDKIYSILDVSSFEFIKERPNFIKKYALNFRKDIIKKIDNYFKKANADVLKPLIIGDLSSITPEVKNSFVNAGVMHILVVSGLHIGFVSWIVVFILKLTGLQFDKAALASIPIVFFYCIATGANPPGLRAAIMFSSIMLSLSLNREFLVYNSMALAAFLILLFQPQQLFTASFQMSFGATLGIICFYKKISGIFDFIKNPILKFFCNLFSVTTAAQLVLIPICMYYFGKVSIISFVANMIIVPLTAVILYLGIAFYFFTFILPEISLCISAMLSVVLNFVLSVTDILGGLQFASLNSAKPQTWQIFTFLPFLFSIFYLKNKRRFIISSIFLLSYFSILTINFIENKNKIFLYFFDSNSAKTFQIKYKKQNLFIIYNKQRYYKNSYIENFKNYLSWSGTKSSKNIFIGFDEEKIKQNIDYFDCFTERDFFSFKFAKIPIRIDFTKNIFFIKNKKIYLTSKKRDFSALKIKNTF